MTAPASREALAAWLVRQRWFARPVDGSPVGHLRVADVVLPTEPELRVSLVETASGDRYQVLSDPSASEPDRLADPDAATALARFVAAGRTATGGPGTITGHWLPGAEPLGTAPARSLGAEQSNSSVLVGGTHVLKVLRRVAPGIHPEVEVGRHLAEVAEPGETLPVAELAGWYDLGGDRGDTALGVVQRLVPGALDGWALTLSALAADADGFLARLHDLGRDVATLHRVLARPAADVGTGTAAGSAEAFGSVPLTSEAVNAIAESTAGDAERLLVGRSVPAVVLGRHRAVAERAAALAEAVADDRGAAIRHHGDLHLGQTVVGPDGWVILDFEGEPSRPLARRRERHSPLRDVAGLLRSLSYAAETFRRAEGARLSPGWEPAARAALLDGYLSTVEHDLVPRSAAATHALLRLFELEKVLYEIDYELAHRPDWVDLPAAGLLRLLDGSTR